MSIHHECIAERTRTYRNLIADHNDTRILSDLNWPEFKDPYRQTNQSYRLWYRFLVQEANKRGLKVP